MAWMASCLAEVACMGGSLARGLLEHAIEHLQDDALLGFGQAGQALDALLQLRGRAALPGGGGRVLADQCLDGQAQCASQ